MLVTVTIFIYFSCIPLIKTLRSMSISIWVIRTAQHVATSCTNPRLRWRADLKHAMQHSSMRCTGQTWMFFGLAWLVPRLTSCLSVHHGRLWDRWLDTLSQIGNRYKRRHGMMKSVNPPKTKDSCACIDTLQESINHRQSPWKQAAHTESSAPFE